MGETRKIAAILVADIVGFTAGSRGRMRTAPCCAFGDFEERPDRPRHRRAPPALSIKRTGDGQPHRIPQRGRRGKLRD